MVLHKAIKGYEDYLITDTGRVYSLQSQKYLKQRANNQAYLMVKLCKNGTHKRFLVHRLVAETFIPNPDNKQTVDHVNRDRTDNRVENLRWATHHEQCLNRNNLQRANRIKESQGMPIIEVINDEVSIGCLSLREVPDIEHPALAYHINKGETDFTIKQRNGRTRHFKTVSTERSDL